MTPDHLSRGDSHLYVIHGDGNDFFTGEGRAGVQLLVVISFPSTVAVFFDIAGNLLRVEEIPLLESENNHVLSETAERHLNDWLKGQGYHEDKICVKRFFLSEHNVGIMDFPTHFCDMLRSTACDKDQRDFAMRELGRWTSDGVFQFWLNRDTDLWIDGQGNVTST